MYKLIDIYRSVTNEATYERDAKAVNMARRKSRKLNNFIKKYTDSDRDIPRGWMKANQYKGYGFKMVDVTGDDGDKELIIVLGLESLFDNNIAAAFGTANKKFGVIVLPILQRPYVVDEDAWNKFSTKSFVHEYIHYLDWKRYDDKNHKRANPDGSNSYKTLGGYKNYLNSPTEFNAIFSEILSGVFTNVEFYRDIDDEYGNFKKFRDIYPSFKELLQYMKRRYHTEFDQMINSKYKKKFYKRVYNIWDELKDKNTNDIEVGDVYDKG